MDKILGLASLAIWGGAFLYTAYRFTRCIRLVPNRKAYIVERLGKYHQTLGPGFHVIMPFFDKVAYIQDMREESIEVPPQDCFTKDNVQVEVDGVLYISVVSPEKASYGICHYRTAAILRAQTSTRSVIGTLELDRTFEERDEINHRVVAVLDEVADDWGIKVHRYEIKNIVPPQSVRQAMERQMAAERQRRAVIAQSEGEKQSMVNESEGRKFEAINTSEGEMTRRINEAEGRAQEILAVSEATAESITKLSSALTTPGGSEAIRLRLSQNYFDNVSKLARPRAKVLVPADITNLDGLLASVGLDTATAERQAQDLARELKNKPAQPRTRTPAPPRPDMRTPVPPSDAGALARELKNKPAQPRTGTPAPPRPDMRTPVPPSDAGALVRKPGDG